MACHSGSGQNLKGSVDGRWVQGGVGNWGPKGRETLKFFPGDSMLCDFGHMHTLSEFHNHGACQLPPPALTARECSCYNYSRDERTDSRPLRPCRVGAAPAVTHFASSDLAPRSRLSSLQAQGGVCMGQLSWSFRHSSPPTPHQGCAGSGRGEK